MIRETVAFSVKRKVTILMMVLAVMAFGMVGFFQLPLNLLPDVSYPSLTVQTEFPNAAPGEVEQLVTELVEEAVGVLEGLKEMHSVSRAGVSEVILEFQWGADMDMLSMDVREKLDRMILPDEAEKPIVLRYDPALDPIMRISLAGESDPRMLRYVAEEKLKEIFERIEGVAAASVKGGEEEEIQVNLDQGKLAAMGISPAQVGQVLASSNINRPGGSLKNDKTQFLVRTLNEYDSVAEIGELTITPSGRPPVKLSDVATVVRGVKDREEITRVNGVENVVIEIFKEGDANTVTTAKSVKEAMVWIPSELPEGMTIDLLSDQSRFIETSVQEVRDALVIGGVLAIIILLLFLRDWGSTVIITCSIPVSVMATFILMYKLDVSLNIMSLGGLTLGIGMLVDSSIVVLESIHRQRELGLDRGTAAILGASEVGGAVIASVLTTVAVFFPIVFVEGIAGQLFRDQSLTVTFSLLASMVVSLSLIPMLSALGRGKKSQPVGDLKTAHENDNTLGFLSRAYEALLRPALRFKYVVILMAFLCLGASLLLIPFLDRELIPALTEGEFYFEVSLPEGVALPATDKAIQRMESAVNGLDEVALIYSSVGSRDVAGGMSLKTKDENLGQVNVVLKDRSDEALEIAVADRLRDEFQKIPNLDVKLGRPSFFSFKTPVEILFFSEDLKQLQDYMAELTPKLARVQGLVDVRSSLESGNPELNVVFDRDKLARLGFNIRDLSETLHSRVNGTVVSKYNEADRQIDIRLRNRESDRADLTDIDNMVVGERNGVPVTLRAVADIQAARGPSEIHRIQQGRVAILSADLQGRGLAAVMGDMEQVIAETPPPEGIVYQQGGQNQEMQASFKSMAGAMILAIFLVYLVMAGAFESLIHPFIILFTIPLALIGAILGLYLSGESISVIALIGAVFLIGVVVNNAIVLVDAVNHFRREGMEKQAAVIHAGKIRLRPILMTTLTTILGLLPMAVGFGEGSELRTPLAVVVSTGLAISTLLTLVVIPAAYMIVPSRVATYQEQEELDAAVAEAARLEGLQT